MSPRVCLKNTTCTLLARDDAREKSAARDRSRSCARQDRREERRGIRVPAKRSHARKSHNRGHWRGRSTRMSRVEPPLEVTARGRVLTASSRASVQDALATSHTTNAAEQQSRSNDAKANDAQVTTSHTTTHKPKPNEAKPVELTHVAARDERRRQMPKATQHERRKRATNVPPLPPRTYRAVEPTRADAASEKLT